MKENPNGECCKHNNEPDDCALCDDEHNRNDLRELREWCSEVKSLLEEVNADACSLPPQYNRIFTSSRRAADILQQLGIRSKPKRGMPLAAIGKLTGAGGKTTGDSQ